MQSNLYFLNKKSARQMLEAPYAVEKDLQDIVAHNPQLLLRDASSPDARLFLVTQEQGIQEGDVENYYSLDHLIVNRRTRIEFTHGN